jgi:hypothetical protein
VYLDAKKSFEKADIGLGWEHIALWGVRLLAEFRGTYVTH